MSKTEYYRYRILDGLVRGLYTVSANASCPSFACSFVKILLPSLAVSVG